MKGFAEQCMAEYDLDGWTVAGPGQPRRHQPHHERRAGYPAARCFRTAPIARLPVLAVKVGEAMPPSDGDVPATAARARGSRSRSSGSGPERAAEVDERALARDEPALADEPGEDRVIAAGEATVDVADEVRDRVARGPAARTRREARCPRTCPGAGVAKCHARPRPGPHRGRSATNLPAGLDRRVRVQLVARRRRGGAPGRATARPRRSPSCPPALPSCFVVMICHAGREVADRLAKERHRRPRCPPPERRPAAPRGGSLPRPSFSSDISRVVAPPGDLGPRLPHVERKERAMTQANAAAKRTEPADITAAVVASFEGCPDERVRELVQTLVKHLHAFATEVASPRRNGRRGSGSSPRRATSPTSAGRSSSSGRTRSACRCSWTLSSNVKPDGATESTVLGPFYVPGSPRAGLRRQHHGAGGRVPAWIHGRVLDVDGCADRRRGARRLGGRGRRALRGAGSERAGVPSARALPHARGRQLRVPDRAAHAVSDPARRAGRPHARGRPGGTRGDRLTST